MSWVLARIVANEHRTNKYKLFTNKSDTKTIVSPHESSAQAAKLTSIDQSVIIALTRNVEDATLKSIKTHKGLHSFDFMDLQNTCLEKLNKSVALAMERSDSGNDPNSLTQIFH